MVMRTDNTLCTPQARQALLRRGLQGVAVSLELDCDRAPICWLGIYKTTTAAQLHAMDVAEMVGVPARRIEARPT